MRGHGESNGGLWYTIDLEELIERDHPLRAIKRMVDEALRGMDRASGPPTGGTAARSARRRCAW